VKIGVMVYSLDSMAGAAKLAVYQSREMALMGHHVDVWAVEYDPDRCYPDLIKDVHGLHVHSLRRPGETVRDSGGMAQYLQELWKYYRDQRELAAAMPGDYDVVNPHGNAIHWGAAAYKWQHPIPAVWMCNDFWPMTSHNYPTSSLPGELKKIAKQALVTPFDQLDRAATRAMDEIAVLSERPRSQMAEHYGVSPVIVRAGIDSEKFAPTPGVGPGRGESIRARYGFSDHTFLLLTVCLLMPRRRIEDALQAIRMLADDGLDVAYLLAGRTDHTPEYTQFIHDEVTRLHLNDRVKFAGEISESSLIDCYHACDAFVWPADENQSWGLACMEAMAAGRPILVSRANGVAEALTDGQTALLFAARAPQQIASAVQRLLSDTALRRSIAANGQQLVHNYYSWRSNAEAMLTLLEKAIVRHHAVYPASSTLQPQGITNAQK